MYVFSEICAPRKKSCMAREACFPKLRAMTREQLEQSSSGFSAIRCYFFLPFATTHCLLCLATSHGFYLALIALVIKPLSDESPPRRMPPLPRGPSITPLNELLMSSVHLEPQIITRPALGALRAGLPEAKGYATAGRAPSPWVCQMRALPSLGSFIPASVCFQIYLLVSPFIANQKST